MGRGQAWGRWIVVGLGAALTVTGCGSSGSATAASSSGSAAPASSPDASGLLASAKAVASALTSANPAAGGGTGVKACAAFTPAEVAAFVGVDLAEPEVNGPMGTQCQWVAADPSDDGSSAEVQIVGLDYWEPHSPIKVAGIVGDSFVGESLGGWEAGAKDGDTQVVLVAVTGPKASRETASEFLKLALSRL